MDNVTHALAGGVFAALAVSYVERRTPGDSAPVRFPALRRAAALVGVIAAELPDADLLYAGPLMGMGKLGYLLHHRGHTHTVLFAVVGALLVWMAALALNRELRAPPARNAMLALALAGTLSHLALDYTNSYGVHPFWPLDDRWFYGDAIFIIEPWLWVVAIPPLMLLVRGAAWRALLGAALAAILVAAWSVDLVERNSAIAFTIGTVAWFALVRMLPHRRRALAAICAWLAVEAVFFSSVSAARARVRTAVGGAYRDAALTPLVGNPLCVRGLVVTVASGTYRVTEVMVAPFPSLRGMNQCGLPKGGLLAAAGESSALTSSSASAAVLENTPSGHGWLNTLDIGWGREWSAPQAKIAALAASNCEVSAALQFIRVPAWLKQPDGRIGLFDLRYANDATGWAAIVASEQPAKCPAPLPGSTPPRSDMLNLR